MSTFSIKGTAHRTSIILRAIFSPDSSHCASNGSVTIPAQPGPQLNSCKRVVSPSPILLWGWGCSPGEAASKTTTPFFFPPCVSSLSSTLDSLAQPLTVSASAAGAEGQSSWCWRRSPLLKKWKSKWTQLLPACPLVPHWPNPCGQKATKEEFHFKKQLREIKPSFQLSQILILCCSHAWHKHTVFICPSWNFTESINSK